MAKKTRFFCVAVEGATTDGRVIERGWIDEMAASYKPETYTASINVEHLRGFSPEPPFNNYGKVVALEARDIEIELAGKKEERRALFAAIEPNDQLLAINAKGQKLFTSCEVNPNFAGTGKAYLVGLAVTDTPASLGTELLQFAAGLGDNNPLAARKQDKANLFTVAGEHVLDVTPAEAPADPAANQPNIMQQLLSALGVQLPGAGSPAAPAANSTPAPAPAAAPATPANDNFTAALAVVAGGLDAHQRATAEQFATLNASLKELTTKLSADEIL